MATQTPLAGWTEARKRRGWLLVTLAAFAGLVAWWAMYLPWAGLTLSTSEPVCATGTGYASEQFADPVGQPVTVQASGCWSAYHSVQPQVPTTTVAPPTTGSLSRNAMPAPATVTAPLDAPRVKVTFGYPAMTVYLALAAVAAMATGILRNAAFILPAPVLLLASHSAFVDHRLALTWGLGPYGAEMGGVTWHQVAWWAVAGAVLVTAWFVVKVNGQQRKLDGVPHPVTRGLTIVATYLFRINADRLTSIAEAGREAAAGSAAKSGSRS